MLIARRLWRARPLRYGLSDVYQRPRLMIVIEQKLARTPEGVYCPVRATLALLGQKWVPHIVYQLMEGKRRFNVLAHEIGGCNSRTLRDRLAELEQMGIVSRHIVATMPPWVEYELTARGRELGDALTPLQGWGRRHLTNGL